MGTQTPKLRPIDLSESYERNQFQTLDQVANRLSFLSEASRRLSSALTNQECFQELLELMVPAFCDFATISLMTERGEIKRVALAHMDPEKAKAANNLLNKYPPRLDDLIGPGNVIRTRKSEYDFHVDSHPGVHSHLLRYPELAQTVQMLKIRSRICVPMEAHGQILGALWMVVTDFSGRHFEDDDLKLAEEVASRAALSVFHLFAYERASKDLERLTVEREMRETFLGQVRHDALSVLTTATLSAQLIIRKDNGKLAELAGKIVTAIEKAAEIIRKTK
ncbi:MAG: GAF domain-containing protein [Bdellovibrionia bacterium]